MPEQPVIPQAVERRLILNFLGFRLIDRVWVRGELCLNQEAIDRLDDEQWHACVSGGRKSNSSPGIAPLGARSPSNAMR
jgi:hypothetical protein